MRHKLTTLFLLWFAASLAQAQTTNFWTNSVSGKWETPVNWSQGAPSISNAANVITNAGAKVVLIDAATGAATLTVSNLVLAGPNTLLVTNTVSPFVLQRSIVVSNSAMLVLSNAILQMVPAVGGGATINSLVNLQGNALFNSTTFTMGASAMTTGAVWVSGAQLVVTNSSSALKVGASGVGQVVLSNGTFLSRNLVLGDGAGSVGTLTMIGGTHINIGTFTCGRVGTGNLWIESGQLVCTNDIMSIGSIVRGQMTISNGVVLNADLTVGLGQGTLTVAGGTQSVAGAFTVTGLTGTVWITGGRLNATNSLTSIAYGQMIISNGAFLASAVRVAGETSNNGTLTIAGGTNSIANVFSIGVLPSSTGTVWVTGGFTRATDNITIIAESGVGRMIVSNGTLRFLTVNIAQSGGAAGTLSCLGGTNSVYNQLLIGVSACNSSGQVIVNGGRLFVTNDSATATVDVNGTLTFNSGTLAVDQLVLTNICARFIHTGGTLLTGSITNTPAFDADGDGLSNEYETNNGLDPYNPFDDADGDGQSNLGELLAGTNPTNSASFLAITSIAQVSTNILITWMTGPDKTNALERTAGVAGSFATNGFTAITNIVTTGTTTNYLDLGAATNVPVFYYRVRLVVP